MANYTKPRDLCYLPLRKKYRGHFEIIALILEAAKFENATRFSIMSHAKINCGQLKKYLRSVTDMGFVNAGLESGRVLYRINDKGLDFLRQYYVLLGMLLSASASRKMADRVYEAQTVMTHTHA